MTDAPCAVGGNNGAFSFFGGRVFSTFINKWIFQIGHVGWGAFLTLALQLHFWWGWLAVLAGAALKEFVFDKLTKSIAPCGNSQSDSIDFLFIGIGVVLGIIARYA